MNKDKFEKVLAHTYCSNCGEILDNGKPLPILELEAISIFHISCPSCGEEFITINSPLEVEIERIKTDLKREELSEVLKSAPIDKDDILDLYTLSKKGNLWRHLKLREEQFSAKRSKSLGIKTSFRA